MLLFGCILTVKRICECDFMKNEISRTKLISCSSDRPPASQMLCENHLSKSGNHYTLTWEDV